MIPKESYGCGNINTIPSFQIPDLYEYFYELVKQIPEGSISTYKFLACALGDCRAARAVGQLLKGNPRPIVVPCHRVIMSDGAPGGYAGPHTEKKIALLRKEGVYFQDGRVRDFEGILFRDFETTYPLRTLREEQQRIGQEIVIPEEQHRDFKTVLGLDISYHDREARGAGVLFEEDEVIEEVVVEGRVDFPYISTYLSYRELPVYLRVLEQLKQKGIVPELVMTDGNGILHPRGCGIGAHLYHLTGLPVVGVAKSRLCGTTGEFREMLEFGVDCTGKGIAAEVHYDGNLLGHAFIYNAKKVKNPVFVSPGGGVSFQDGLRAVAGCSRFRLPEPIRAAHRLASRWE